MAAIRRDRLREFLDLLVASLDDGAPGEEVARRAFLSRYHFDRLVAAGLGEPPGAFARRLLLERAAWSIAGGGTVTDAALAAGYGSPEAFTRAFARAYGRPPSRARDLPDFRLPAPNGVHFHPPAALIVGDQDDRRNAMDLTDRMVEHDLWLTRQLLDAAATLDDAALDHEVRPGHVVLGFDGPEPTVRLMLDRLVWTKEVWLAAIRGESMPSGGERTLEALRSRLDRAGPAFAELVADIRDRQRWNVAVIDALCEPPQRFPLGAIVAHVLTFSAHRRQVLAGALRELGADVGSGCPIEWEQQAQTRRRGTGGAAGDGR